MSAYRIVIDRSLCSGFGSCVEHASAVFELGSNGIESARQLAAAQVALAA